MRTKISKITAIAAVAVIMLLGSTGPASARMCADCDPKKPCPMSGCHY